MRTQVLGYTQLLETAAMAGNASHAITVYPPILPLYRTENIYKTLLIFLLPYNMNLNILLTNSCVLSIFFNFFGGSQRCVNAQL